MSKAASWPVGAGALGEDGDEDGDGADDHSMPWAVPMIHNSSRARFDLLIGLSARW